MNGSPPCLACVVGWFGIGLLACANTKPAGSVLVTVDTDVDVPRLMDRMRVDVFALPGMVWLDSRDVSVRAEPAPGADRGVRNAGAFALPFSFALQADGASSEALLRIRGYRDGKVRDYRGERFEAPVVPAIPLDSVPPACERATTLKLGDSVILDVPAAQPDARGLTCGQASAAGGFAAAKIRVENDGMFTFQIDQMVPNGGFSGYATPMLFIVRNCEEAEPIRACAAAAPASKDFPPELLAITVALDAGDYAVLLANRVPATLEARLSYDVVPSSKPEAGTRTPDVPETASALGPRLVANGIDRTPSTEPEPSVTIDRLARIPLDPNADRVAAIRLTGDCYGVMADLFGMRTCMNATMQLEASVSEGLLPATAGREGSASGRWRPIELPGCDGTMDSHEERVCVPGGVFTLGDGRVLASEADAATPEHVVVVDPFYIDRYEFTVARYRALRASGIPIAGLPVTNSLAIEFDPKDDEHNYCTFAPKDTSSERDDLPLTCVDWTTARSICRALGGTLPTSAQWEFAAAAAGKSEGETLYPWGDQTPGCEDVVYGRWGNKKHGHDDCYSPSSFGPVPVHGLSVAGRDRTPLGIVGLGGNVSEWTLDSHRDYSHACWGWPNRRNPACIDSLAPLRTVKGGAWRQGAAFSRAPIRIGAPPTASDDAVGFRCVYAHASN
jgi:formylglycine-generating enzyme required for sulfatase activity